MREKLHYLWRGFQKVSLFVGNIISTVFMIAFYFSLFALVALPARFFGKYLAQKGLYSNWVLRGQEKNSLQDFQHE
ncbi:MAG TPA: hypothetical protein VFE94_03895 [Candidatus Paceibacterota bacterium]|nr:hypothetical protein [Candidatus Paceibacterota bacterium]